MLTQLVSLPGGVFHLPCSGEEELCQEDVQLQVHDANDGFYLLVVNLLPEGSAGGGSSQAAWVYRDPALDTIIV